MGILTTAGIPCAPVQDMVAMPGDPQIVATGLIQSVDHPVGPVRVVGSPFRVDGVRPRVRRAPPTLGQHTVKVLTDLGLSREQLAEVAGADTGGAPRGRGEGRSS
ncbi:MAG: hypothetical protein NVS3B26_06460 [Mycobacteriales bacterium]